MEGRRTHAKENRPKWEKDINSKKKWLSHRTNHD